MSQHAGAPAITSAAAGIALPRTQFDHLLLPGSHGAVPPVAANRGRQCLLDGAGSALLALTWGGDAPMLRLYRDRQLLAAHALPGAPTAPCLLPAGKDGATVWLSAGQEIYRAAGANQSLQLVTGIAGELLDALLTPAGKTLLLVRKDGALLLHQVEGDGRSLAAGLLLDQESGAACMELLGEDELWVALEKESGIDCCRCALPPGGPARLLDRQRVAEAYGSAPTLLAHQGRMLLAYLGESCRLPGKKLWNTPWQSLGRGGYIALLCISGESIERHTLADSQRIVLRLAPTGEAYSGGPNDQLRVRIEEFSAPALTLGPDGVPVVLWANLDRRWVYSARYLGASVSDASEVFGPLEKLLGPPIVARRTPQGLATIPAALITGWRSYLNALALPRTDTLPRQVDFVQLDELSHFQGLERKLQTMTRRAENPVLPVGARGEFDDGAIVADVRVEAGRWHADYGYRTRPDNPRGLLDWKYGGRAVSADGIHWEKREPISLEETQIVEGCGPSVYSVRFVRDDGERDPQRRYKGLWRSRPHEPWGWIPVISADGKHWRRVDEHTVLRADDDLQIIRDEHDAPQRRFKALAIGRSYSTRVVIQFASADAVNWEQDIRDTLDFENPFTSPPDRGTTGRILMDAWAGTADEGEIHGGYVFRDGQRFLLHYMKWTPDGHVYTGLASSRDGEHFSRVAGGATLLPLGEAGAWDAGRVAIREAPFRVGDTWRQYYVGAGWKHGLAGRGAKTSPVGHHAPNQLGMAEIAVGRLVALQLAREVECGELRTVPLQLARPARLCLDGCGLGGPGRDVSCAVFDAHSGEPVHGLGYEQCDAISADARHAPLSWKGGTITSLPAGRVTIGVQIRSWGVRLFGLYLTPQ